MVERWVKKTDFRKIVEPLILKPIVHPFQIKSHKVTKEDIELLKTWASVGDSVGTSVWTSVWTSVRDSVGDSVGAYTSSFFSITYKFDFSPAVTLWERGFVPSFDGKIWRLYSGPKAKIVYEWKV